MKVSNYELLAALVCGDCDGRAARPVVGSRDCVTAAVISKPRLFVISVDAAGAQHAAFNPRKSRSFELSDRSAGALQTLNTKLVRFFTQARIEQVFLRISSDGGSYVPHPWHFKIEAALQLVDELKVTFINTHSVRAWANRDEPVLPRHAPLEPGARWRDPQVKCLETALFVAANAGEARFFSDGSNRHG